MALPHAFSRATRKFSLVHQIAFVIGLNDHSGFTILNRKPLYHKTWMDFVSK